MKKLLLIPILLLLLTLSACQGQNSGAYSAELKLNIEHINENDANKNIDIAYPVFGGISNKETITIVNTSIYNYVKSEYDEFENALTNTDQHVISAGDGTTDGDTDADSADSDSDNGSPASSGSGNSEPISLTMSFKITYNKNDCLCVVQTFQKELGQNKTFNGQRSFFFSLENAAYLSLGQIFNFDNSEFTAFINDKIKAQLKTAAYTTYDGDKGFTGISKNCNFYFDNEYLYLYYNALEISPDMDVIPTFAFKIEDVKPYLNEDYVNIF